MTQDELKTLVGRAALDYVPQGAMLGVGTGSTVNKFIEALADCKQRVTAVVSSSQASTERLQAAGIKVVQASQVQELTVYIDGADEIDPTGCMIKGGGAALTREKIVAALARQFVCIVDQSKQVSTLGAFPLPVEVIPMAVPQVMRQFAALGGVAHVRLQGGVPLVTENAQHIIDVSGLHITDPWALEMQVNQWPGVVTVGVFAKHKAHVCLLGTEQGVKTLSWP